MYVLKIIIVLLLCSINNIAQIYVEQLSNVSEAFKKKYYSRKREYNPLQIGNIWQFSNGESGGLLTTSIVKDSIINGKRYYKKISYQNNPSTTNFVSWERNDTTSGVSFMLDFQDVNKNGNYLEELPLDSLENRYWSRYLTYKYSYERPNPYTFFAGTKTVLVKDTSWVKVEGDTLISRYFEILELYWGERIIEKFGVHAFMLESPMRSCLGARINGKVYGKLVGIDDINNFLPNDLSLENNYPNPFNPNTNIVYSIPLGNKQGKANYNVTLVVYDILGREITVLVNEKQNSGRYSISFNGSNLTSGIYYYSLLVDSKRLTKSMVLLK